MPAIPLDRNAWTEPGTFEVAPGVYRIPLPLPNDGLRAVNVYALVHGADLLLIDSGWAIPGARAVLDQALAALGATAGDVRRILVTHVHRDHYTQAISVDAGRGPLQNQLAYLRLLGAGDIADRVAGLQGPRDPYKTGWEAPDECLRDGQVIPHGGRSLDVVATPGHTRGHVVFHDAGGGLLFAGDHVLPTITPSLGFGAVVSE